MCLTSSHFIISTTFGYPLYSIIPPNGYKSFVYDAFCENIAYGCANNLQFLLVKKGKIRFLGGNNYLPFKRAFKWFNVNISVGKQHPLNQVNFLDRID